MQRKELTQGRCTIALGRLPHALRATYEWTNPDLCAGFLFLACLLLHYVDPLEWLSVLMGDSRQDIQLRLESQIPGKVGI